MHTKKTYLLIIISAILVLSIVAVQFRLTDAMTEIVTMRSFSNLSGCHGEIVTRSNELIYDGEESKVPVLHNLIGCKYKGGAIIENSISNYYTDSLLPRKISPVTGYHILKGLKGRVIKTSLLGIQEQSLIANRFENIRGSIFAYNYVSGEVYISLSLPSSFDEKIEGSMVNTPINGLYTPGSTMKIISLAIALSQQPELKNYKYNCSGNYILPDGNKVDCNNRFGHGELDMTDALGLSCNCYFASLITKLDVKKAADCLKEFGFDVNNEGGETFMIDKLSCKTSCTRFKNTVGFQDVWGLIGQGDTNVSPVNMAMIAGSIANGGKCANPYIIESIKDPNHDDYYPYKAETKTITMLSKKTSKKTKEIWEAAVKKHYNGYDKSITMIKTGTAQVNGKLNRLLIGVIPTKNTAFYIATENTGDIKYARNIANTLAQVIPVSIK